VFNSRRLRPGLTSGFLRGQTKFVNGGEPPSQLRRRQLKFFVFGNELCWDWRHALVSGKSRDSSREKLAGSERSVGMERSSLYSTRTTTFQNVSPSDSLNSYQKLQPGRAELHATSRYVSELPADCGKPRVREAARDFKVDMHRHASRIPLITLYNLNTCPRMPRDESLTPAMQFRALRLHTRQLGVSTKVPPLLIYHPSCRLMRPHHLYSGRRIHQLENVVEDVVGSALRQELEYLRVAHRLLLFINQ